eukprot:scaffold140950_cov142-Phaeocystis_antarctica.AAC.1
MRIAGTAPPASGGAPAASLPRRTSCSRPTPPRRPPPRRPTRRPLHSLQRARAVRAGAASAPAAPAARSALLGRIATGPRPRRKRRCSSSSSHRRRGSAGSRLAPRRCGRGGGCARRR